MDDFGYMFEWMFYELFSIVTFLKYMSEPYQCCTRLGTSISKRKMNRSPTLTGSHGNILVTMALRALPCHRTVIITSSHHQLSCLILLVMLGSGRSSFFACGSYSGISYCIDVVANSGNAY